MWYQVSVLSLFVQPKNIASYEFAMFNLSIHGHLGCSFLALRNNVAMDISVLVFVWMSIFSSLGKYTRVECMHYMVTLRFPF